MIKRIRYFCGFMDAQEKWLNTMSRKGYRLMHTGKLIYEFEECKQGEYVYCVDFVADKSYTERQAYKQFLEDIGYRVLDKNANLDWSVGKVRIRPYGKGMGKIATAPGQYQKELLIVEKVNDNRAFELHSTMEDKIAYYKTQRNVYFWIALLLLMNVLWNLMNKDIPTIALVSLGFTLLLSIPTLLLQKKVMDLIKQSNSNE